MVLLCSVYLLFLIDDSKHMTWKIKQKINLRCLSRHITFYVNVYLLISPSASLCNRADDSCFHPSEPPSHRPYRPPPCGPPCPRPLPACCSAPEQARKRGQALRGPGVPPTESGGPCTEACWEPPSLGVPPVCSHAAEGGAAGWASVLPGSCGLTPEATWLLFFVTSSALPETFRL